MRKLFALAVLAVLAACTPQELPEAEVTVVDVNNIALIEGTLSYLTREAIPTPYVVVVELFRMVEDGEPELIAATDFEENTQVPVSYMLAFNADLVDSAANSYMVNARFLTTDGAVMYEAAEMVDPFIDMANTNLNMQRVTE